MTPAKSLGLRIYDWIDERSGITHIMRSLTDERIRGGASWAYVFGSSLVFLFILQAITGICLALYFVPSADHAHASVAYIQKAVPGGQLLRGLHQYGSSLMVILVVIHMAQTFLFGAYKGKRELLWILGILLFILILGFAFTGCLLPWDQAAYFGTKVGTSIVGEVPLIGEIMQRILLGGSELTTLTLSRFFMLHAFLFPFSIGLLILFHIYLFRRAGAAGPFHHNHEHKVEPFYPNQLFLDATFILVVFIVLVVLAEFWPAELGPMADPTSDYLARPAWYFLPLFQLLKYFPGQLVLIPAVVLPGVAIGFLFLLPFMDRSSERNPVRRPAAVFLLSLLLASPIGLIALSKYQDRSNSEVRGTLEKQREVSDSFLRAAFHPQEIGRSIPIDPPQISHPTERASTPLKIYFANCANCHGATAAGGPMGPSLVKIAKRRDLSREALGTWIQGHMREPVADSMPSFKQLTNEEIAELSDWLVTLDSPLSSKPEAIPVAVRDGEPPEAYVAACAFCHGSRGEGNIGPSLIGISAMPNRTPEDLLRLLKNSRAYGLKDPMPKSFPKITDKDKGAIVRWIGRLTAEKNPSPAN